MTLRSTIEDARELITEPSAWIKGNYTLCDDGLPAEDSATGNPVAWCLVSAIGAICIWDSSTMKAIEETLTYIIRQDDEDFRISNDWGGVTLEDWQDHPDRTHEDVLNLLDKADSFLEDLEETRTWLLCGVCSCWSHTPPGQMHSNDHMKTPHPVVPELHQPSPSELGILNALEDMAVK